MTLLRQQRVEEAAALRDGALRESPDNPNVRFASALVDRLTGEMHRAVETLESLHAQSPGNPALRAELATTRVMAGRAEEAIPVLEEIARAQPNQPFAHYWLGQAHLRSFRGPDAVHAFERVLELNPTDRNVLQPLAAACLSAGNPTRAESCCRELLQVQPDAAEALGTLAAALEQQDRISDAEPVFRRLLGLVPSNTGALAGLARVMQAEGKRAEARELLEPHLESPNGATLLATYAGLCETSEQRRRCIARATSTLSEHTLSAQDRASLCFAAARLLDSEGEHDSAFDLYLRGNALYPQTYDPSARRRETDELIRTFSRDAVAALPTASSRSSRPIFILGMPRSGTTLVEQILGAHPDVHPAGELQELRQIWRDLRRGRRAGLAGVSQSEIDAASDRYLGHLSAIDSSAAHVTDKMPHNFERVGLIRLLFPEARVVHCTRDPLDTCVSCFTVQFGMAHAYSNSLESVGHAYGEYARLMRHWKETLDQPMLEVRYEDTVEDIERVARELLEFLGLPWNDSCLRFYEVRRSVTTASVDQVRRPIYNSSIQRWRRYADHLAPLREALLSAGVELSDS